MEKINLDINSQIEYMKNTSGIKFEITNENEAHKFLRENNYYFKVKAFAKNYDKYNNGELRGKYINLDFAYLQELSRLDMVFRKFIINMTLDIEHFAKTKLLYDCSNNKKEDGYKIVDDFLKKYPYVKEGIQRQKNNYNSVNGDLIRKYSEKPAIWNIVEMITFGDFIKLYELYYRKNQSKNNYANSLWSVKCLRNAAAHNSCILNTIKNPYNIDIKKNQEVTGYIAKVEGLSKEERKNKMKNPIVHDFVVLIYIFSNIISSRNTKEKTFIELKNLLLERCCMNKEFFDKNSSIKDNYKFIKKIVEHFTKISV